MLGMAALRPLWMIGVSGACSRSGKTALAVTLLHEMARPDAIAVKFTTTDDVFKRCPRGKPCVVCDIAVPYRLVEDPRTLREPGTDTDRLAGAGASRVVWCIARRGSVGRAWEAVSSRLGDAPVVIEGSTIVGVAKPDLHLFVAHPFLSPRRWKPESARLIAAADAVIVNLPAAERRAPDPEVSRTLVSFRGRDDIRIADVTAPLGSWAPDIRERMALAP